ncbi:gp53-like domain-containing protein [Escherichia coli]
MLRIGQVEATATQDGKYTDGSVAGGIAATRLRAAAFNAMQEELAHIVESAGLALDINDMTQVLKAIQKLTLSRANPFADIKSDGAAAISTALTNLGLKTAAQRDVGTGANQIPDMSAWASGPGWRRTPDGFIEQFGGINFPSSGGAATSTWVAFPISFPTGNIDTLVVYDGGFGSGNMWGATDWSGTGFTAHCNSDGEGARYFARGK